MLRVLLLCSGLMAASPEAPSDEDLAAYRVAQAAVGRDAGAHVRLALWCESRGLAAERRKHLAMATLIDPDHPAARGLLGQVPDGDRWRKPEEVAEKVKEDAELAAKLAEYNARRAKASPKDADDQWKLAVWCEERGLDAEATAHFTAVTTLDPSREAAWKHLGFRKQGARWMTPEQIAAEKAERQAQAKADDRWLPLLRKWKGMLRDEDPRKRDEAETALAELDDPRAAPSVWKAFAVGGAAEQALAVRLLGQIDARPASQALAALAVFGKSAEVRRSASESLRRRDPREFARWLISLLRDPIKHEVRPVGGPGSPGAIFVQGERFNVQRLYAPPPIPPIFQPPGYGLAYDGDGLPIFFAHNSQVVNKGAGIVQRIKHDDFPNYRPTDAAGVKALEEYHRRGGLESMFAVSPGARHLRDHNPSALKHWIVFDVAEMTEKTTTQNTSVIPVGRMVVEYEKTAAVAQAQLASDVAMLDAHNSEVERSSGLVAQILRDTTGENLGQDREAWKAWWANQLGYHHSTSSKPRPTLIENVPLAYTPRPTPASSMTSRTTELIPEKRVDAISLISCFGAGTPVHTLRGLRPIETLSVGDQVLAQDVATGALGYRPILVVHHNPPSATLRVRLGDEDVISSTFHRFWKAGHGWIQARDLKVGDTVRTLDGPAGVTAIEPEKVQPVFNLDVADSHSFFVGDEGALVHDNTVPGLRLEPFDAPMVVARGEGDRDR
jgi:hypothetical protein